MLLLSTETKDKNKSKYWYLDEELKEKKPVKVRIVRLFILNFPNTSEVALAKSNHTWHR